MYKITFFLLISLLSTPFSFAQDKQGLVTESQTETTETTENEFNHLVSAKDVVFQLRKNYGIEGSVLLSKTMLQILNSFSNQQQAQKTWQTAINEVTDIKTLTDSARINTAFNAGQILSKFTHGMNVQKWDANRSAVKIFSGNIKELFTTYDDLTVYFNLQQVWELLLIDIAKQENIQWNEVFANSLDLFAQEEKVLEKNISIEKFNFFEELNKWKTSKHVNIDLAVFLKQVKRSSKISPQLYQTVVRFEIEKRNQKYLSASLIWLGVAQQLNLHKTGFSNEERKEAIKFIDENDTWFLSNEQKLLSINLNLPEWMEQSFQQLKSSYGGTSLNKSFELVTIYQMLDHRLENYMSSPFRQTIRKNLEVCLNISEEFLPFPQEPIDKKQFEGCLKDITKWAIDDAVSRELSGSLTKVESENAIDRALQSPNWQTINIIYANASKKECLDSARQLANPLEWSVASEYLLWFADRWPAYMHEYSQNIQIDKIIKQGELLTQNYGCLAKPKSDTLNTYFNQTLQAWHDVKTQIKQVAAEFNQNNLSIGSDLDLIETSDKPSNYKVAEMTISACDAQASCGVHVELEASKALFALFPNHLLVADQLKIGALKLCYDDIGWENRRAALTDLDNDNVANYFGNFSFSLKGFYNDELVFSRKLVDKQEYKYLFGENTEEVLETACPLEIVGQKISTKLARGTYGLVPNRLTFLTASRADESRILEGNWKAGDEWNNLITSDEINSITENKFSELNSTIQQAYQQKAALLQETIYKSMLNKQVNATDTQKQLAESFKSMQRTSKLFASMNYILQMNKLMLDDDLHGLFYGSNKLPDIKFINKLYQNQLNINSLIENIDNNIKSNQEKWNGLDKSWSNQYIKDIIFRLKSLIE